MGKYEIREDSWTKIFLEGRSHPPCQVFEGYTNIQENGMASKQQDVLRSHQA